MTLIETVVALGILGMVSAVFMGGVATTGKASIIASEQAIAESLVRSQLEYVKNIAYQQDATEYPVDPELSVPDSWAVPQPVVAPVHATDDGIQKVTVSALHNGETVLTIDVYKVDR